LKFNPGLIREGLFKKTRNPNYLGEMMIYGSYALLARHWLAWVILLWVWLGYFLVNMLMKERSLSRFPEWIAYKKQSGLLFPKLFPKG
jgi:protein-S-isoprenylcysteine O-methyltransferase Ste14